MVGINRRELIEGALSVLSTMAAMTSTGGAAPAAEQRTGPVDVTLIVNGELHTISVEPRTTLLDALRGQSDLTGTKKAATAVSAARALCILKVAESCPA